MSDETKDRLKELQSALQAKVEENEQIEKSFKVEDNGGVVVSREQAEAFRSNLEEMNDIKGAMEAIKGTRDARAFLEAPASGSVASAAAAHEKGAPAPQPRTPGEMFVNSDEFKALQQSGRKTMDTPFQIGAMDIVRMGAERKDIYTGLPGTHTSLGFGERQYDGIEPREHRRTRVRDLFPAAGTTANLIDFFRVTGFAAGTDTSSADTVGERTNGDFALKPQSELQFTADQAPVRTIAHFEAAHRNVLDDEPQLQATIDNELLYGLRLTEDDQILNGDGSGDNLRGILNTPDIQSYDADPNEDGEEDDNKADAIRRAATRAILAYYDPNGVVLHPYDWEAIELKKDDYGRYLITVQVAVGAERNLFTMEVVDTPAMSEGNFLVGAFGMGAQLYDRMDASIRVAEQHSDFFVRNAIVILAEQRLALAVKRPESFVHGEFHIEGT